MNLNLPETRPLPPAHSPQALLGSATAARASVLLAWAVIDWMIIAASWWAMAYFDHIVVALPGIVIVASRLHAFGVILHDACHRSRRDNSPLWFVIELLAGVPIASTVEAMRYHHLRHHAASGTHKDPYLAPLSPHTRSARLLLILRGALLPAWWTARAFVAPLALLFRSVRNFYGRAFLQDRSGVDLSGHGGVISCARSDLTQLTVQVLVLGAAFSAELPVLTYYITPWLLAGIMNARRVLCEHAWVERDERSRSGTWQSTIDHDIGFLGNALLYPHNIGLHRIHHLYPAVAFVHLRRLARAIRAAEAAQT